MKDEYEAKWWADHYIKAKNYTTILVYIIGFLVMVVFSLLAYIVIVGKF